MMIPLRFMKEYKDFLVGEVDFVEVEEKEFLLENGIAEELDDDERIFYEDEEDGDYEDEDDEY